MHVYWCLCQHFINVKISNKDFLIYESNITNVSSLKTDTFYIRYIYIPEQARYTHILKGRGLFILRTYSRCTLAQFHVFSGLVVR